MFQHQGIWLPDGERHFPEWMDASGELDIDGRGTYQIKKWRACIPWIKFAPSNGDGGKKTAIDVGAHVGFWSYAMLGRFYYLHAFEPVAAFRECWLKNMYPHYCYDVPNRSEVTLHECALGAATGRVSMNYNPADSGNTHVGGDGEIELRTIDSFEFPQVDFIKIDCEGYEHHVIEGARETIARCRPCIIVEQKQHKMAQNYGTTGTPAVDLLREMGAHLRTAISGDYIMSFD